MKKIRIISQRLLLICIIHIITITTLLGSEYTTYDIKQKPLDIVFVVDYSNSMNGNDSEKMALQMIEAFIDEAYSKEMRVGFVAYNHHILESCDLTSLHEKSKRTFLKSRIHQLPRRGSTDTGLALKTAKSLLHDRSRQGVIVLISDGEPDLSYVTTGRTAEDSLQDMTNIGKACATEDIPIYTAIFGKHFDGASKCLEEVAATTRGQSYRIHQAGDLVDIFNTIIEKYTTSKVVPIVTSLAAGTLQTIEIPFENTYTSEMNLLLVSSSPLQEANVWYEGQEIEVSQSKYYFTTKIDCPNKEMLKLQYRAAKGAYIKLYIVLYPNMTFHIDVPKPLYKQQKNLIDAYFTLNATGEKLKDAELYKRFHIDFNFIKGKDISQKVILQEIADGINGNAVLPIAGDYTLKGTLKDKYYNLPINLSNLHCEDAPPNGACVLTKSYPRYLNKEILIDLSRYFKCTDGDHLSYTLSDINGESIQYEIKGDKLWLKPCKLGKTSFKVVAMDSAQGKVVSPTSTITILPLWAYHIKSTVRIVLGIGLAILLASLYFIYKRSKREVPEFSGKLSLYFTGAPEEIEIPPLTFSLFQIKARSVTMYDLLQGAGYNIPELEMDKIVFEPGFNREMIFYHNTQNSVMIGSSIACRKLKYSIGYGTKLYITANDESYDLEVHFVSAKM